MTENIFRMVEQFNQEVLGISKRDLNLQDPDELELSIKQLEEEIQEFKDAVSDGKIDEVIDAMIDLIYFAAGIAYKNGVRWEALTEIFQTVHLANMQKAAGKKLERNFDGDAVDATKPSGWTPPDVMSIINKWEKI